MPPAPRPAYTDRHLAAGVLALVGAVAGSLTAQGQDGACRPAERTALVLAGGGARALAHAGVLRVLDSLGVHPQLVVGTSMGAVVGALYASGMSGRAIDSVIRVLPVSRLFRRAASRMPQAVGDLHPLLGWEGGSQGLHVRSPLWGDAGLNMFATRLFLRGDLLARGDFDSLPIPFRAVATDLSTRTAVVLDRGDLAQAVRASYAIPVILPPVDINGRALVDGGLAANVPVRLARAAGATRVIVSELAPDTPRDSIDTASPLAVAGRMIDFLFEQPPDSLGPGDVRIVSHVAGIGNLDFAPQHIRAAVDSGMAATRRAFAGSEAALSDACGLTADSARPAPRPTRTLVTGFTLDGDSGREARALAHDLDITTGRALDPGVLDKRLDAVALSGRYSALWLTPEGSGDSVRFDAHATRAPPVLGGVGLAYDADVGGRLWVGAGATPTPSRDVDIGGVAFVGGLRRGAVATVSGADRPALDGFKPSLSLSYFDETVRQFTSDDLLHGAIETHDGLLFAGFERTLTGGWSGAIGAEGRVWQETGVPWRGTVGGMLRAIDASASGDQRLSAEGAWTPVYQRIALAASGLGSVGRLRVRPHLSYAAGEHLPLDVETPLGGLDGFAGFRYGDRRGDRTVFASTTATYLVIPPVQLILEGMSGASRLGGAALPEKDWVTGTRGGLGADTPVGPVRVEYGVNTTGHGAWVVRLGYWF